METMPSEGYNKEEHLSDSGSFGRKQEVRKRMPGGSLVLERALDREPQVLGLKSQFWLLMWD